MADRPASWPAAQPPPPGWMPAAVDAPPPGAPPAVHASRPAYREPHPVRFGSIMAGGGAAFVWLALFGSLASNLIGYAWWTLGAAISAWTMALVLARIGDRGVAVGIALCGGLGLSIACAFVAHRWITTNDWPLW